VLSVEFPIASRGVFTAQAILDCRQDAQVRLGALGDRTRRADVKTPSIGPS